MLLPETTPQQRMPMYEDISDLITVGFLSLPVQIGELTLNLRSFNDGDLYLLRQRIAFSDSEDFHRWLVATSIWMVDGVVLLSDINAARTCFKVLQDLRPTHLKRLVHALNMLTEKQRQCYDLSEAFCQENFSRYLWRQTGGVYPSPNYNGLPTSNLGMNAIQRIWLAHNRIEDIREQADNDWANAKMVASATSPKGVEQLTQKEKALRETEKTRKQEMFDRLYYKWLGFLKDDGTTTVSDTPVFRQASTADELAEEMRKWVSGELDFHDQVVAEYKRKAIESYQREMAARKQRVEEVTQELQEAGEDPSAVRLVGYTLDQLRDRVDLTLRKTVYEAPKGAAYLYERYGGDASKGTLDVREGKVVVREEPSLNEQVADRKVNYKG